MLPSAIRKEVVEFAKASETILSSVLISPPLSDHECALIAEYVRYLGDLNQPWNEDLIQKSA
jgi:hypothetical protein